MFNDLFPLGDPRSEEWPLMDSPVLTSVVVLIYLLFVTKWGPSMMASRSSGFNIKRILVVYNVLMVMLSGWLCFEFCAAGWIGGGYSLGCQLIDMSRRPKAMRMVRVCWVFYISKIVELLDTVFFVLRKKPEQVTFLHVFHHAIMPISWWFGMKYVPGGLGTFHAMLNSFIHFLMYTYYGLAAAGEKYRKYLWWKRYMTTAQIVQFIAVIFHSIYTLSLRECTYPKVFNYWILSSALIFLVLFMNFYSRAYAKRTSVTATGHQNYVPSHRLHSKAE